MAYLALVLLFLAILAVIVAYFYYLAADLRTAVWVNKTGLKAFLESQYVPEARLLRAATRAWPDNVTIWIASDNLLAARALEALGSLYASKIEAVLEAYGGGYDGEHEVLLGVDIPGAFYAPRVVELDTIYSKKFGAVFTIKYEIHDTGAVIRDWEGYADLIVYRALDSLLEGSTSSAEKLFEKLVEMWDGYGFRDKAFRGVYSSYKLALGIYLYKALKAAGSETAQKYRWVVEEWYRLLAVLQRSDGGIVTGYSIVGGRIVPIGDANTETTSIVALALYSSYPERIGGVKRDS